MIQAINHLIFGSLFFKLLFSLTCLHNPRNALVLGVRGEVEPKHRMGKEHWRWKSTEATYTGFAGRKAKPVGSGAVSST